MTPEELRLQVKNNIKGQAAGAITLIESCIAWAQAVNNEKATDAFRRARTHAIEGVEACGIIDAFIEEGTA